ncbi:uncharacterized protein [Narcine bancroftii]|uniref:uncharacterized protein n=1 Tax=Narcine bancroftii TaxID=1343680 RepID=UPI003831C2F1
MLERLSRSNNVLYVAKAELEPFIKGECQNKRISYLLILGNFGRCIHNHHHIENEGTWMIISREKGKGMPDDLVQQYNHGLYFNREKFRKECIVICWLCFALVVFSPPAYHLLANKHNKAHYCFIITFPTTLPSILLQQNLLYGERNEVNYHLQSTIFLVLCQRLAHEKWLLLQVRKVDAGCQKGPERVITLGKQRKFLTGLVKHNYSTSVTAWDSSGCSKFPRTYAIEGMNIHRNLQHLVFLSGLPSKYWPA